MGPNTDVRVPEVVQELENLKEGCSRLGEVLEKLKIKLNPILREISPTPLDPSGKKDIVRERTTTAMSKQISEYGNIIFNVVGEVEYLLERLEI